MTNAVSLAQQASTGVSQGFKNRIINGAMVIDQRNAGASFSQTNAAYNLDRWLGYSYTGGATTGKYTVQRNSTAPTGFINSLLVTSSAATADNANNIYGLAQAIEGFNIADLDWGTANAKTVTLSFWVRSSLTGTFGGSLQNAAQNRSYPFTYTISSANTYEYKTITIAGDTSGTWGTGNGIGIYVNIGLGVGSNYSGTAGSWSGSSFYSATGATSVVGTNGATFYITGVQLEVGSTATSFDYRPYGTELALCQRYAYRYVGTGVQTLLVGYGGFFQSAQAECVVTFPVTMRTSPSTSIVNGTNWWRCVSNGTTSNFSTLASTSETPVNVLLYSSGASGTQGLATRIDINNSGVGILFSAEL